MIKFSLSAVGAAVVLAFAGMTSAHAAVDADAAQSMAKKNDCFKCHAIDKTKKGPSYKKISAKYKGKADGMSKVVENMTKVGHKVKLEDGTEEEHKVIDSKDEAAIKNLASWILAQ